MDFREAAFLLGSNLGNRYQNLTKAKQLLEGPLGGVLRQSAIYQTAAWGGVSTTAYLNQVLVFRTDWRPEALLELALATEQQLGRQRLERWGDRSIDIDLLLVGQEVVSLPDLVLPHPRLQERSFVLVPLLEVAPDWQHPLLHQSVRALQEACSDGLAVELWKKETHDE